MSDYNLGTAGQWIAIIVIFGLICGTVVGLPVYLYYNLGSTEVETKARPVIDTVVVVTNGVSDTTFHYNFND